MATQDSAPSTSGKLPQHVLDAIHGVQTEEGKKEAYNESLRR